MKAAETNGDKRVARDMAVFRRRLRRDQ